MKSNLILLHGALGSKEQFIELKEILSESFEVFDFNFAGHGGQALQEPFSIELFVTNTLDFMNHHAIKSAHFFGYSMGGYVALKLAHDFPGRAKKIITLGTKFDWNPESAAKEVRMMNPEVIEKKIPKFAETLSQRHQPEDWKKIMNLTAEMMTALGAGKAMDLEDFNAIENEVLVCVGSEDHMVTQEESEQTSHHLKNAKFLVINGFKHPIESVDKNVLSGICKEFLL